jgi:hypothetical protein
MPPARVVVSLLLLALVPSVSAAEPLLFKYYNESQYGRLFVDERPGGIVTGYNNHGGDKRARLEGPTGSFNIVGGFLEVTSGPFISETIIAGQSGPRSIDVFAAGGTVNATWVIALPDGSTRDIDFSADLGAWNPLDYTLRYGGSADVPFFHGMLDVDDAAFFGTPARWLKGTWTIELDHDGSFDNGPDYRGMYLFGWMEATSVPEPAASLLLLTAAAGLFLHKRRAA